MRPTKAPRWINLDGRETSMLYPGPSKFMLSDRHVMTRDKEIRDNISR